MKWTNSYRSFGLKTKRSTGLKTIEHKQIRVLRFGRRPRLRAAGADTTFCPACGASLIVRDWYAILSDRIGPDGCCPDCGAVVPGHW